ncbi:MAG: sensory protein TspO [Gemmataceae bacterium]|nr:sensory protein TspO [Gemmataceae bacterium]
MSLCTLTRPHPQTADEHRKYSWGGGVVIVAACLAVEAIGRMVAEGSGRSWYPGLPESVWTPPGWVFGPVLTILYVLMGVAGSLVWLARDRDDVCCPLTAFAIQLAAGLVWPVLFFGLQNPLLGFVDVLVLWFAVGLTVTQVLGVSQLAGWLLVPYWGWVTYTAAVNGAIVFRMT